MKKFFISSILLIISVVSYGQLTEDFENGTFSSEWTVYSTAGTATGWQIGKTDSISKQLGYKKLPADCGKYTAIAVCGGGAENVDSWLITPKVHITENQYLNFMMSAPNAYTMSHDTLDIMISTTTPAKEAFTQRIHRIIPRAAISWGLSSIDLSNFAGQDIYIGFRDYHASRGSFMKESLFLDNISISASPSHDLALEAVLSPANSCNTSQNAQLVIQNNGANTTSFEVGYKVDEQDAITETIHQTITGGTKETITLANPIVLSEGKEHTVVFWIKNTEPDTFITNDTVTSSVKIGSELPFPYVMPTDSSKATADFTSLSGQTRWSYILPQDRSKAAWALSGRVTNITGAILMSNCLPVTSNKVAISFNYHASDKVNIIIYRGAPYPGMHLSADTLELPMSDDFSEVTCILPVTETSLSIGFSAFFPTAIWNSTCEIALKDICFSEAKPDIQADRILNPVLENIPRTEEETVLKVNYQNIGAGAITDLKLCYQIDEGSIVRENIAESILEGTDFTYSFHAKTTFSVAGKHTLVIWSESDMDGRASNDTIRKQINVYDAAPFPFTETFAEPANWSILNEGNDAVYWSFMEHEKAVKDGAIAYKNTISTVESNDYLISPAIHMPAGKARLSFYYATSTYNTGTGKLKILMGTDPMNLTTVLFDEGLSNSGWLNGYAPITIETAGNYYFAFYGYGTGGEIFLDYVNIDAKEDLCINSIAYSETSGFNKSSSDVTISFINHGVTPQSNLEVAYAMGTTAPLHSETITRSVAPGDTLTYTFKQKADISTADSTYNLIGIIQTKVGEDTFNDATVGFGITHWSNVSLPYSQNFETVADIERWALNTKTNNWQLQKSTSNAYDGSLYIFHSSNSKEVSDDWIFSECIEIPAGTYDLSYFYRTWKGIATDNYKQNLKIMLGTDATPEAMTQEIADYNAFIISRPAYNKQTQKLIIREDGKYYLGFHCYSDKGSGGIYIDNINITLPETGKELPYTADFENHETDWTHYNPSSPFNQWVYTNENFDSYMYVKRTSTFIQPEGILASPALKVEKNRKFKLTIDYAVISEVDTVGLDLYYGTVNNPDSMTLLKHLPAVSELSRATEELQFPEDGNYYFGFKSNSTAVYELKLGGFAAEYTGASGMNETRSELNVYQTDGKIRIISGTAIKQVIVSDISGKQVYNRSDIREKSLSIPTSGLLSGIYILQIADENGNTVRKIQL